MTPDQTPRPRDRLRRPLPWPCSRISPEELHALWLRGQIEQRTISKQVHEAVARYIAEGISGPPSVPPERDAKP